MVHRLSILVALIAMLAACGGAPTAVEPTRVPTAPTTIPVADAPTNAPAVAEAAASAFPVAIKHKYGTTEILQTPERVVSVGFNDQDAILALGVVPVGIRDWYGEQPNAVWPWAQDELGGATPQVLPANALNFEQIAALNPDLIIGISSGMTEEDYATLSAIAPTVPQSGAYIDYGVPWQEQTRVIGQALGRSEQAEALITEVEGLFADARAQNPAFKGASAVVAVNFNSAYSAYGPQDVRGRLLTSLGFVIPQEIVELTGNSFFTAISNERLDLIDTDVLVIAVSTEKERQMIESDPLFQQLNAAQQGRVVFLDQELSGASSFSSVLSLPYLLERLVPLLAAARTGSATAPGAGMHNCPAGFRLFAHSAGETCVPANPQRIVAVDYNTAEELIALGVTPTGILFDTPAFLRDAAQNVPIIGDAGTPNLERIAALEPDLIIAWPPQMGEGNYERLAQIAPTVLIERNLDGGFANWREELLITANLVGRTTQAKEQLGAFDTRTAQIRVALAERGRDQDTISVFGSYNAEYAVFNYVEGFAIEILNQAGLQVAPSQVEAYAMNPDVFNNMSLELLPQLDADWIFFLNAALDDAGGDEEFINATVKASPLFQQLGAVQNGHVCEVPYARYNQGSLIAANLILDDIERCLLNN